MASRRLTRREMLRNSGLALATAVVAGCSSSDKDGTVRISMTEDLAFDPAAVSVSTGTTVRWHNDSDVPHTVTAYEGDIPEAAMYFASGGFESEQAARNDVSGGLIESGETFEYTVTVAGSYRYICLPHEGSGMTGRLSVGE